MCLDLNGISIKWQLLSIEGNKERREEERERSNTKIIIYSLIVLPFGPTLFDDRRDHKILK